MKKQALSSDPMDNHAISLSAFIQEAVNDHVPAQSMTCVYVYAPDGGLILGAALERETLTDGSVVFNIRLSEEG